MSAAVARTFTCTICGKVDAVEDGDDADALAELEIYFPGATPEECDVLCDDCYATIMAIRSSQN